MPLSFTAKRVMREALARVGVEVGAYAGSYAASRDRLIADRKIATVFDVGAHRGGYLDQVRRGGFAGLVVCFEPNPAAAAALSATRNRMPMMVESIAIGATRGSARLYVSDNEQSSSLLRIGERHVAAAPASRQSTHVDAEVWPLDDRVRTANGAWDPPFLLKVDVQGFESQVLRGAGETLQRTQLIELELSLEPLYEGGSDYADVLSLVHSAGFRLADVDRVFADSRTGELLQLDALFVAATL